MTSTNTLTQPETEQSHPQRLQLSATQVIASALAAVTATVAGSFLGVSGTVIGAAIASVLTVIGNAVYGHSLKRTSERVRTVVPPVGRWHAHDSQGNPVGPDHLATTRIAPAAKPARKPFTRRQLAIAAVGLFAAVLALVTTVELAAGSPLSDLLRGKSGHGTTVFGTTTHHSSTDQKTPAPTVTQTVTPSVVTTTPTVTQTAPTVTTPATPTTPTATPTKSAPSTPATPTTSPTPTGVPTP